MSAPKTTTSSSSTKRPAPALAASLFTPATRAQAQAQLSELQDSLQLMLNDSAGTVRARAGEVQREWVGPVWERGRERARGRPVMSTFLAIFLALSLLPMLTFLTVVLSAGAFLAGLAVLLVLLSLGTVVFLSSLVLLPTLCFTFFLAAGMTTTLLGVYTAHRLVAHVRENETLEGAARAWIDEARSWMTTNAASGGETKDQSSGTTSAEAGPVDREAQEATTTETAPNKLPPSSMNAPLVLVDALRSPAGTDTKSPNGTLYAPVLVDRDGRGVDSAAYVDEKRDNAAWEVKLERGVEVDAKEWGSVPQ